VTSQQLGAFDAMPDQSNPWTTLSTKHFYDSPYIDVEEDQVQHRSGRVHAYTALRFRVFGITVLPIDQDGCTYLIGQHRYVSGVYTWELVRGAGPLNTDPLETARKELLEETGLVAERWLEVFRLMASPGITDERAPCFLAWNLTQHRAQPDPEETLSRRRIHFADAVAGCLSGEIVDGPSAATILAVYALVLRGEAPPEVAELLSPQLASMG